jgi:hypothetical protein
MDQAMRVKRWILVLLTIGVILLCGCVAVLTCLEVLIPGLEEITVDSEQGCIDSAGTASTPMCCKGAGGFSSTCIIGDCGCAPE